MLCHSGSIITCASLFSGGEYPKGICCKAIFVSARTNKRHHHHHEELPRHSDQVGQEMEPQEYLVMIHPPDPPGPTVCQADADAALAAHPPDPLGPTEIAAPIPIHLAAAAAGAPTQS